MKLHSSLQVSAEWDMACTGCRGHQAVAEHFDGGDCALPLHAQVKLWAMTDKLGITPKLKADDKELVGKPLMKRIMQTWLPAHEVRPSLALHPEALEVVIL